MRESASLETLPKPQVEQPVETYKISQYTFTFILGCICLLLVALLALLQTQVNNLKGQIVKLRSELEDL